MHQLKGMGSSILTIMLTLTCQQVFSSEPFLDAARDGDLATLQSLLEGGGDVNAARVDGSTALAWAVYGDHTEAVELLLRAGADVNAATDYGVTPLFLACANNNSGVVNKLLNIGADPHLSKETGETPLMRCASAGAIEGVKALLAHGADPNASESDENQTALMWAVAERHPEVVRELVAHGADVNTHSRIIPEPDPYVIDIPPGLSIFGSNYPPTVRFPEVSGGFTALHYAAQQGDIESARILLAAGADIDGPNPEHGSALVIAIASGHEEFAMFMLEQGADVNVKDAWGITPLHYALHEGVLILNNFKPNNTDEQFDWTRRNMPSLVGALLDHGADPDARIEHSYPYHDHPFLARSMNDPPQIDPVGATPLLLAAASGDVESMRILEEASDPGATTIGGATIFLLAAGAGAERGARQEREALEAARFALVIGGGSVNDRLTDKALDGPAKGMEDGRTALHFATTLGWTEMIRFLVEQGADIEAKDRYGMTPLQLAMGDPEGRYHRQIGDGSYDSRYREPPAQNKGNQRLINLILELGAEPFTGTYRDRSGE